MNLKYGCNCPRKYVRNVTKPRPRERHCDLYVRRLRHPDTRCCNHDKRRLVCRLLRAGCNSKMRAASRRLSGRLTAARADVGQSRCLAGIRDSHGRLGRASMLIHPRLERSRSLRENARALKKVIDRTWGKSGRSVGRSGRHRSAEFARVELLPPLPPPKRSPDRSPPR